MEQQNNAIKRIVSTWRKTNPHPVKKKREIKLTKEEIAKAKKLEDARNKINRLEEEWY